MADTPSTPQSKQITVDVPEDRVAEFYAFFARFLAGPSGRGRRGRHGGPCRGRHGWRYAERREADEQVEATETPAATTEV